jgi:multiple sugar transport system permease protein
LTRALGLGTKTITGRAACLAVVVAAVVAAAPASADRIRLVVWGLPSGEWTHGRDAAIAEYQRRHPELKIVALSMGAGGMNPQKLMTSIVGHVPPDVVHQDRFTIGDWAARDAFMQLDDFLAHDSGADAIRAADYYPACWREAVYRGHVYAVPYGTDDRALYWNRQLFREAGLDPDKPPRTWDELLAMAVKLTKYNPDGTFERMGFIPNFGNSWLYLYSWQNGGEFMSTDSSTCTLHNSYTTEALQFMVRCYDALKGAERIGAFSSTFQPNELDPFYTGKVAMKIDGCGYWRIYWGIMLPQIRPALAAVAIMHFLGSWNDFMGPLIYISSPEKMTGSYALQLFQSAHGGEWALLMAAATLWTIPILLLFFFAQRYFIQGVTLTGIKG